jgi:hypothetical protein
LAARVFQSARFRFIQHKEKNMANHKIHVTTPKHFTKSEHQQLRKAFKSVAAGVLKRRKPGDSEPVVPNVETTIAHRRSTSSAKKGKTTKKHKAAKK